MKLGAFILDICVYRPGTSLSVRNKVDETLCLECPRMLQRVWKLRLMAYSMGKTWDREERGLRVVLWIACC